MVYRCFIVLALFSLVGCYQTPAGMLEGKWLGKPDSTAAAKKRGDAAQTSTAGMAPTEATGGQGKATGATDLEAYDIGIHLDFHSDKTVEMALADGSQPRSGIWRVVTTLPPNGAEIEITWVEENESPKTPTDEPELTSIEKRRFLVEFENGSAAEGATEDEGIAGFTLREKGAEIKFGRLFFAPVAE